MQISKREVEDMEKWFKIAGGIIAAITLMFGCNTDNTTNKEAVKDEAQNDDGKHQDGTGNVTDRDREILDNRDDGTNFEVDDGGTDANNDQYDGTGGNTEDKEQ
ncbi:hypothetical protein [Jeotgalibacillus soli]|uniref:Lipoprotein n=1 Tax=Jeotgalibacillus soli TaxID=889306 RepID=A0A0C2RU22_9BACL|nr:hypothetical protein [Jeotgalibacillus soli]KIL45254.1 hypothetical protein KP78_27980 [Jeotgalibacillus soli]